MRKLKIVGGETLTGTIRIGGAKNSAVALIPAALLAHTEVVIDHIPNISDIEALQEILSYLKVDFSLKNGTMQLNTSKLEQKEIPEEISKKLRASYYFMGSMLARYKDVTMHFPGGCAIGKRPIDLHLKGFEALGAHIEQTENHYHIYAEKLVGTKICLDIASVGATVNIMLAATGAEGITTIVNAAKEPEIENVAQFLNSMGAKITGAGTDEIQIEGAHFLDHGYVTVIPDRIEAGTYLLAGCLTGDHLILENVIPKHMQSILSLLKELEFPIQIEKNKMIVSAKKPQKTVGFKTEGYPGFPTDLQQPMTVLLTQCKGNAIVEETIYEDRFQNIVHLNHMGAHIEKTEQHLLICGPTDLIGKKVEATDLRAGACLVLAALIAHGETEITNIEHILRGYENIIEKLKQVGAKIWIEE